MKSHTTAAQQDCCKNLWKMLQLENLKRFYMRLRLSNVSGIKHGAQQSRYLSRKYILLACLCNYYDFLRWNHVFGSSASTHHFQMAWGWHLRIQDKKQSPLNFLTMSPILVPTMLCFLRKTEILTPFKSSVMTMGHLTPLIPGPAAFQVSHTHTYIYHKNVIL